MAHFAARLHRMAQAFIRQRGYRGSVFGPALSFCILAVTGISEAQHTSQPHYAYHLEQLSWRPSINGSILVEDIDEDRRDEFLFWEGDDRQGCRITYYDEDIAHIKQEIGHFPSNIRVCAMNWDSEGDKEIVVFYKIGTRAFLSLKSTSGEDMVEPFVALVGEDRDGRESWDGSLRPQIGYDVNGDGFGDIVCTVVSHFDEVPRGVCAYDLRNRRPLWTYPTGAKPETLLLRDVDGDGIPEILCSFYAPGNGVATQGTDDSHSYGLILTPSGRRVWQIETGGVKSGCFMAAEDVDNNGKTEIVMATYSHEAESQAKERDSRLSLYDGLSRQRMRDDVSLQFTASTLVAEDILGDKKLEIMVGTEEGWLLVFDSELNILKKERVAKQISFLLIDDVNKDGEKRVVVGSEDPAGRLKILDNNLQTAIEHEHGGQPFILKQDSDVPNRLLLLDPDESLSLLKYVKAPITPRQVGPPFLQKYGIYGLGALLLMALLALYRARKTNRQALLSGLQKTSLDDLSSGVVLFDRGGHIAMLNTMAATCLDCERSQCTGAHYGDVLGSDNVSGLRETLDKSFTSSDPRGKREELRLDVAGTEKKILVDIVPLVDAKNKSGGRLMFLQDVTGLSRSERVRTWGVLAQRLAHEIKNSLNTMRLALQRMETVSHQTMGDDAAKLDKYIKANEDEITGLLRMLNGLMRISDLKPPDLQPTDANSLITKITGKHAEVIPSLYTLNLDLGKDLPEMRADPAWMETVIENLLANAFAAMGREGTLNIATSLVQPFQEGSTSEDHKDYVQIEISDTGCGLSPQDLDRIFDPFFSKKEGGTGMGLAITKKYVEEHDGTIEVRSQEGIGTTFAVRIPVWKRERT